MMQERWNDNILKKMGFRGIASKPHLDLRIMLHNSKNNIPPYVYTEVKDGSEKIIGFLPDVINIFCSSENIRCFFQNTSDDGYAFKIQERNDSDVYLEDGILTEECFNFSYRCSAEYGFQRVMILSGVSENTSANLAASLLSTDIKVFLLYLWSWIIVSTSLYCIAKFNVYRKISLFDSYWNTMGCLLLKPVPNDDLWNATRLIYITWIVSAFFFSVSFSGTLKSNLTIDIPVKIDCLQDILDKPWMRPIIAKERSIDKEFQNSKNGSTYHSIWEQSKRLNGSIQFPFDPEVMKDVGAGRSVIIAYEDQLITLVHKYCNVTPATFYLAKEVISTKQSIVYYSRHLDFYAQKLVNDKLRKLVESSLQRVYLDRRMDESKRCFTTSKGSETYEAIHLEGVSCAFVILGVGFTVAAFVFILEWIFSSLVVVRCKRGSVTEEGVCYRRKYLVQKPTVQLIVSSLHQRINAEHTSPR